MPTKASFISRTPRFPRTKSQGTHCWSLSNSKKLNLVRTVSAQSPSEGLYLTQMTTSFPLAGALPWSQVRPALLEGPKGTSALGQSLKNLPPPHAQAHGSSPLSAILILHALKCALPGLAVMPFAPARGEGRGRKRMEALGRQGSWSPPRAASNQAQARA